MKKASNLADYFDSIVMLTWSDWHKESRSNRYHYASRFSQHLPVVFVQPDLEEPTYYYETAELNNFYILHLCNKYEQKQYDLLNEALATKNILKPLIWVYNPYFYEYLEKKFCPLRIYHGTEDYFSTNSPMEIPKNKPLYHMLKLTVETTDMLISVSEGVNESFHNNLRYKNDSIIITNGCDYKFYSKDVTISTIEKNCEKKVVFYQGNIFAKLNYELLDDLTKKMPDWKFWYCGKVLFNEPGWQKLLNNSNVKYLGLLKAEEIREYSHRATVGIIPFVEKDWIIERSFPLKSFEYLATGLPVVTVPIKALLSYSDVFHFAQTVDEFKEKIQQAAKERFDSHALDRRLKEAALQDYDLKFDYLLNQIDNTLKKNTALKVSSNDSLKIIVLYDINSVHVQTIQDHLKSFFKYSKHTIYYLPATNGLKCDVDLSIFDTMVIHYSVRLSVNDGNHTLSQSFAKAVGDFGGYKIAFIQDEYEQTNIAKNWIKNLGIHAIFTCVPEKYIQDVYPKEEFPYIDFIYTLTGYIPLDLEKCELLSKPFNQRDYYIGYRGRNLPFWYGNLGQEKLNIGINIKKLAATKNMPVDIEWEEDKRIYGDKWYLFLSNCKATLGTESGSNIFDFDGSIRTTIEAALSEDPLLTYEEAFNRYLKQHEGKVRMNQISPKIFESISLRTALILFEGSYSDVVKPNVHYIPLKKDYSNVEEIFKKLFDDEYLKQLTDQAYNDIILSQKYSYQHFIQCFDDLVSAKIRKPNQFKVHSSIVSYITPINLQLGTSYKIKDDFKFTPCNVFFNLKDASNLKSILKPDRYKNINIIAKVTNSTEAFVGHEFTKILDDNPDAFYAAARENIPLLQFIDFEFFYPITINKTEILWLDAENFASDYVLNYWDSKKNQYVELLNHREQLEWHHFLEVDMGNKSSAKIRLVVYKTVGQPRMLIKYIKFFSDTTNITRQGTDTTIKKPSLISLLRNLFKGKGKNLSTRHRN